MSTARNSPLQSPIFSDRTRRRPADWPPGAWNQDRSRGYWRLKTNPNCSTAVPSGPRLGP
jgi:hypothetical protein